ncbi:hypothetical protein [Burkholderia sp. BCC0397]|uniref:hypothetical protein n=1 Tax=Burkholderia sp. BCC0397 TaxID=486876 RepID=UPI00158D0BC7|nr:hypothetical protein [Burkholderia sp. BCC0397]
MGENKVRRVQSDLVAHPSSGLAGGCMAQHGAVWMLSGRDLRNDFPFFGTIGFIFGLMQWFGYRYFNKSNVGTELLMEHIAFNSLLMTVMVLWFAKWGVERLCITRDRPLLRALIAHVSTRAVALASVAATTVIGFGAAAAVCRNIGPALWTWYFSLYLVAMAEIAANPFFGPNHSRLYRCAMVIVIVSPVAASFMR